MIKTIKTIERKNINYMINLIGLTHERIALTHDRIAYTPDPIRLILNSLGKDSQK